MLYVPAGKFRMGDDRGDASRPAHDVKVSAFWMSRCEVTLDLFDDWYAAFRRTAGDPPSPEMNLPAVAKLPTPQAPYFFPDYHHYDDYDGGRPATGMTQYAAQHFCQWLSARTGRVYRLPTEAEWEYAARGGTTGLWPFGDDPGKLKEYAWFGERQEAGAHRVGLKQPNPWGLCDMAGNAAEWVLDGWSDDYRAFAGKASIDPWVRRKAGERFGVVRGGAWASDAQETRVFARRKQDDWAGKGWLDSWRWYDLGDEGRRVGFRVVSPVAEETDDRRSYLTLPGEE
jgi:formylglycine-generating enzyme required for sulfatase activity